MATIGACLFANNYTILALNWVLLLAEFVCGAYWLSARFAQNSTASSRSNQRLQYEIALMILWAFSLLVSTNVQTMLLYGCYADPVVLVEKPNPESVSPDQGSFDRWSNPPKQPKSHRSTGSLVSFKRKHRNNQSSGAAGAGGIPSLAGLEAVPEGFIDLSWNAGSAQIPFIPNPDPTRNISGSTQQSNLFGAAEYNKRITSAGFVKDEPTPQKFHKSVTKSQTFSHYDEEQTRIQGLAL